MSIQRLIKAITLIAILFICSSCVSHIDKGSFGIMDRSLNNKSHGYQIVDDHTGSAPTAKIERFEVQPGDCSHGEGGGWSDCANDRERSELKEPVDRRMTRSGSEYWYTWSIYFPEDFVNVYPTKLCVGQFHQHKGHVIWMTQVRDDGLIWDHQVLGRTTVVWPLIDEADLRGKWHTINLYVKWSKHDDGPDMGVLKLWVNDELKVDYIGQTCKSKLVYFKYGVYRSFMSRYKNANDVDDVPGQVVYYANVKRAKSESDLEP